MEVPADSSSERMNDLLGRLHELEERLKAGGGPAKIEKQHKAGKLTARERVEVLTDEGSRFFEIGLLVAHDKYGGAAPGVGVVTGVGKIEGRPAIIVANDATVKAGAWWPETISKILRAQEVAMRQRIPIVYLVDSAGVYLPLQDGVFPGQYGGARIFYYNSLMRRKLKIPQIAAVMGPCIAGGAYLPALSDVIIMVEGTSFMGLGGPNLVKGATGEIIDSESLGGARTHTEASGVAHYTAKDDHECLELIRAKMRSITAAPASISGTEPSRPSGELLSALPANHRLPYDVEPLLEAVLDADDFLEFQPNYAPEMLCANARLGGRPVAVIANRRGFLKTDAGPRIGGIVYAESARKVAYFVETAQRSGTPLLYFQDVSGFMVGKRAETNGIIRAGADMVEAMACATVPKIIVSLNHASGAGYYAMAGQGFDPDFTLAWPSARIGVMEGDSAVQAAHGRALEEHGDDLPEELAAAIEKTREDYEKWLDATWTAARGNVDAIIDPVETRDVLAFLLEACESSAHRHLALEVLPGDAPPA